MTKNVVELLISIIKDEVEAAYPDELRQEDLYLDIPSDNRFGDLSTNIALKLSRLTKKSPFDIINLAKIKQNIEKSDLKDYVKEVKVEGAGFINFYLSDKYFYEQLKEIITKGKEALKIDIGRGKRVLIEFVSANPTGSLSVAHARQAVVGDCLAKVLDFLGFSVKREYYLNDEGNQINILGRSV
jgi:arginyl-tRNA synthetase